MFRSQRGNALFYVLIGVILFAALTMVLSRQMSGVSGAGSQVDQDKYNLMAGQVVNHATQMKNVLNQMLNTGGNTIDNLDFTLPSAGTFNNAPTVTKVYHPAGGGLNVFTNTDTKLFDPNSGRKQGWVVVTSRSIGWAETRNAAGTLITPTTDVMYNFVDVNPDLCSAIDFRLTGSATVPTATVSADSLFLSTATVDLNATNCAGCSGRPSLCVKGSDNVYVFYNIVAQR